MDSSIDGGGWDGRDPKDGRPVDRAVVPQAAELPAVGSIAKARMKRQPKLTVFMPESVKHVVYTCMGPGQEPGDPNTRIWVGAPPAGNHGWSLTPEQAEEVAADLLLAAKQVREGRQ